MLVNIFSHSSASASSHGHGGQVIHHQGPPTSHHSSPFGQSGQSTIRYVQQAPQQQFAPQYIQQEPQVCN